MIFRVSLRDRVEALRPAELAARLLDRARQAQAGEGPVPPLLDVDQVVAPGGLLEDLFLMALLTRSISAQGRGLAPAWLSNMTERDWILREGRRSGLDHGMRALHTRVRSDLTAIGASARPLGFPLGHMRLESNHLMDHYRSSKILTVRSLTSEFHAIEHLDMAKDSPAVHRILGVVPVAGASQELPELLARSADGRQYLGPLEAMVEVVDGELPPEVLAFRDR